MNPQRVNILGLGLISLLALFLVMFSHPNDSFAKKKSTGYELLEKIQNVFVDIADQVTPTVVSNVYKNILNFLC